MAQLTHVNTTDLRDAISLGCRTMSSIFNADDCDIPFFISEIRPKIRLSFHACYSEAHVPGRHLNALLNAAAASGIAIDEGAVEKHTRAAFFSYGGPVPLPMNREKIGGQLINFCPHNVREGFHALYALARFRQHAGARELAERSIALIRQHWNPETEWDQKFFEAAGIRWQKTESFITGLARAIGPLVKLHRATGSASALELARCLAEKATTEYFLVDGVFDVKRFGTHTHSTTCTMSGLAQLAELTGDDGLLARVKAFYDRGLWDIRDELGWVIENFSRQGPDSDVGEVNNTGDIVETALIFGRHGWPEYYGDAERILRGHLLPSQLRDNSFIVDPPNPRGEDGLRDAGARHLGAFGFPTPYGHQAAGTNWLSFNMDIVGGAVGSLCEVYRSCVRQDARGIWVNLLFDRETEFVKVESSYTHPVLRVTPKVAAPLRIRIPSWVDRASLQSNPDGEFDGVWLHFPEPQPLTPVSLTFPLVPNRLVLKHRAHEIHVHRRGDEITAMDNFGADLTFFAPVAN